MLNIEEIKAREQAATPGPWENDSNVVLTVGTGCCDSDDIADCNLDADADFIAHARTDIPELIAEVERLTAENAELKSNHAHWHKEEIEVQGQLWKENAALKKALEKLALDYCMDTQTLKSGKDIYSEYIHQAQQLTHETHGNESDMRQTQGGKDDSHV